MTRAGTIALVALLLGSCAPPRLAAPPAGDLPGRDGAPMDLVPAGPATLGSDDGPGPDRPARRAHVPAFFIDRYEVTVARYERCLAAGACDPRQVARTEVVPWCNLGAPGRADHPIDCLTWDGLRQYCMWAGKRLPTEAEWEKAARGDDGRLHPWGDAAPDCRRAVLGTESGPCAGEGPPFTRPVGTHPEGAGPYGTHDLIGNVSEWTDGDYSTGGTGLSLRPVRGGAWSAQPPLEARASHRRGTSPAMELLPLPIGGRCAVSAP